MLDGQKITLKRGGTTPLALCGLVGVVGMNSSRSQNPSMRPLHETICLGGVMDDCMASDTSVIVPRVEEELIRLVEDMTHIPKG